MRNGASETHPIDDFKNGVITFEELCDIIESMPQDDVTPEEQEYYRQLAEKMESDDYEFSPGSKTYRGKEAAEYGQNFLRRALGDQYTG